ncbi:hypothetical protein CEXT_84891 [Caerostris extrusa]|uniref:Uncharacterized protein n=1 Tax=Caerostris extrusa TaxID=172846 RepID=A0AAV4NC11_CAEEX|nr:hypothetical protein CEXT_84891 [Caerostris extrusa]
MSFLFSGHLLFLGRGIFGAKKSPLPLCSLFPRRFLNLCRRKYSRAAGIYFPDKENFRIFDAAESLVPAASHLMEFVLLMCVWADL